MKTITIREACIEDAPLILQFIIDLATYEKAQHEVKTSLAELKESLFSKHSTAFQILPYANHEREIIALILTYEGRTEESVE